jgi:hypothetical protein
MIASRVIEAVINPDFIAVAVVFTAHYRLFLG